MANRSYLYSLSNRPTSYYDRPEAISGLAEWPYAVPLSFRILMSGDPRLCSSLISDGFEDEPVGSKTRLHAISSDFELGFSRLKKFLSALRPIALASSQDLVAAIDGTVSFLESHTNRFLLLETIELDSMFHVEEVELRSCVEEEINACLRAGAAIDALPSDFSDAAGCLQELAKRKAESPLDVFQGLLLNNDFDNVYEEKTKNPIGLEWSDVLYFQLWNRSQFDANRE